MLIYFLNSITHKTCAMAFPHFFKRIKLLNNKSIIRSRFVHYVYSLLHFCNSDEKKLNKHWHVLIEYVVIIALYACHQRTYNTNYVRRVLFWYEQHNHTLTLPNSYNIIVCILMAYTQSTSTRNRNIYFWLGDRRTAAPSPTYILRLFYWGNENCEMWT